MNKSKIAVAILASSISVSSFAGLDLSPVNKGLSAEAELACTVILCMASSEGYKVAECRDPIRKYFKIKAKKWHKTIQKRKNFLKLCPDETASNDMKLATLTYAYAEQAHGCDVNTLNQQIERKRIRVKDDDSYAYRTYYRVLNKLPAFCANIYKHEYTDWKKPKNICSSDWYDSTSWQRGSVATITGYKQVGRGDNAYEQPIYHYEPINKTCWVNQ
ncbi:hypothetical protein E4T80_11170 [Muribacter muris]|uniref:Conjugal transfer protein TrbM n=1 Tax=Muribacter muris TaxID=67855 RepID=A0A4Y9JUJ2_9PAST|nr:TrbM/KikA/MpfK family conjugal transfer protein [Muribacter muris]MBF0786025.1 hypothetical protein [Muribacter muris]MBF0826797.1 hypothetical protein [Muribacter muris]TFV08155.1 hypothetical protein E4T80_11170 [Muribacter muris]